MSNYQWSVTGGTITAGSGTYTVTVTWNSPGPRTISVNYTNNCGLSAAGPATINVTVNPLPPATITPGGATDFCQGSSVVLTASGGSWYLWSTGATTTAITVATTGNYTVTVTGTGSCTAAASQAVIVNPLPTAAGNISGPVAVAQGHTGIAYSVAPVTNATGYHWNLPSGATIAGGANTNSITVDFSPSAQSGNISVYGTNDCGSGTVSRNSPSRCCHW